MANQIPVSEASTGRVVKDSDNGEVKVFIESQKEVVKGVEKEESEFDKPLKFMGLKKVFNLDPLSVETDKELSYIEQYGKERGLSNVKLAAKIKEVEAYFHGNGRVLIRPSGTEPLVRVMIEGDDLAVLERYAGELKALIEMRLG